MAQQSSFIEELMAAGRGVFALLLADRNAARYFDFSRRGLAGSFIALALVLLLNASLPVMLGEADASIFKGAVTFLVLLALQIGFSILVLRQTHRMDGLVPYLVADNWATFFLQLIGAALAAAGLDVVTIIFGLVAIYIEVNIARFIVTLTPLQVAMFLIAQVVGLLVGVLLVSYVLFPLPPEAMQQIMQQLSS